VSSSRRHSAGLDVVDEPPRALSDCPGHEGFFRPTKDWDTGAPAKCESLRAAIHGGRRHGDQDRQQLLDTIAKLDRRARVLAAVVQLLLALLRASGFIL
jgi:hypothetical protein